MANVVYFNTANEVLEYGKFNNIQYISDGVNNARNGWKEYFEPFKDIEGCEVLYYMGNPKDWSSVGICIRWRGVTMTHRNHFSSSDKTQALRLVEPLDTQGLQLSDSGYNSGHPQKIGKPTAKKLDEWKNWLVSMRKHDEGLREKKFAEMTAKIAECCELFPEAKEVKWDRGYWSFNKVHNGIEYTLQINTGGEIYERLKLASMKYPKDTTEMAAALMQNALEGVKLCKDYHEAGQLQAKAWGERVERFKGGRPF